MAQNPLDIFKGKDDDLLEYIESGRELALSDGALSKKIKLLIAVALDAAHGAENGTKSLALQAKQNGASNEEIMEAIRVAGFIAGVGAIYTSARALKDVIDS